jgi:hypothetical protein
MNLIQRYVIHPQDYTYIEGFLLKGRDPADVHIPFCIWTVLLGMVPYEVLRVSSKTWSPTLYSKGIRLLFLFLLDLLIMSCFHFWIQSQFALNAIL